MKTMIIIFFGGGLGSLVRYLANRWVTGLITTSFPYGTFLVNITACFLIGFFIFITERMGTHSLNWRWFLVTGFCGGYTFLLFLLRIMFFLLLNPQLENKASVILRYRPNDNSH